MNCSIRLNSRLSTVKSGTLLLLLIFLCSCQLPDNPFRKQEPVIKGEKFALPTQPPPVIELWQKKVTEAKRAEEQKQWSMAAGLYNEALDIINNPTATPQRPSQAEIQSLYSRSSLAKMLANNNSVQLTRTVVVPDCSTLMRTSVRGVEITKHLIAVEFKYDDTVFTDKGKYAANELAYCLKEKQQGLRGTFKITLVGHTDETGRADYNKKLSVKRAKALKKYLEQQDPTLDISTEGKGETEPLPNKPDSLSQDERYQLDRRVEVITGS